MRMRPSKEGKEKHAKRRRQCLLEHKKNIPWWLIITMLVFFWPVGLVLMFIKIFGDDEGQKRTTGRKNNYR